MCAALELGYDKGFCWGQALVQTDGKLNEKEKT